MAMGSTGTVNMTPEMLRNALSVIEEYRANTNNLHTQLSETISTLLSTSFSGSAADGFKYFYDNSIEPAIGEGLTKLLDTLKQIVEETLKAIPDVGGLDDQLGEGNRQQ
ncbi:WXG100 family type VII secretion target [Acetivibrio clariflavus]|uniref:WXG100 family type VII secretion target n=1 Tax=Acetivibrio clariflavus (strain DSM 19732 / NBRC 101661 / EBR45) TaxID=720554 RepID=G8LVX6_ACECE|nr:WXG100 family type VII secretion target [Acetivibrio clariflavus]AEV67543.1 hypothetical protein Clocl_0857 [Acetivibrio clariflavus DSM 19732]